MDKELIKQALISNNTNKTFSTLSQEKWAVELRNRFTSAENIIKTFKPSKQYLCERNKRLTYMGASPTLSDMQLAFGIGKAEAWLMEQIQDLYVYESVNYQEKATVLQIEQTAGIIASSFYFLKLTELMLFFFRFKAGRYGKPYGNLNGREICNALNKFTKERIEDISRFEKEEEAKRINQPNDGWTYDEYLEVKWLLNMGYERKDFNTYDELNVIYEHIKEYESKNTNDKRGDEVS